jgi:ankyrin repeat protein
MRVTSLRTVALVLLYGAADLGVAGLGAAANETALVEAVKTGNRDGVRALLAAKANVNAAEPDGTTPLHWAVLGNDVAIVDLLLRAGAKADVLNHNRMAPLALAALNGNAAVIERLVAAGADVNVPLTDQQTVLMTAARSGGAEAVRALLAHGAKVDAREQRFGETALMWAAAENHPEVIAVLTRGGADVNARSAVMQFPKREFGDGKSGRTTALPPGSWTPLMYAARQNAMAAVKALAAAGADLNATDPDGTTPLVLATINAHYDMVALLLELGADPNIGDVTGMTPLYAAVDLSTFTDTPGRPTPVRSGKLDTLDAIRVLLEKGANPNVTLTAPILMRVHDRGDGALGKGATALMRAAKKADTASMKLLLEHGADPRLATQAGITSLMFAAGFGGAGRFVEYEDKVFGEADRLEAATVLLDRGADVHATDPAGQTALHIAATERDDAFVRLLAGRGAKLDAKNKQGQTPLDLALGQGGRGRRGGPQQVNERTASALRALLGQSSASPLP